MDVWNKQVFFMLWLRVAIRIHNNCCESKLTETFNLNFFVPEGEMWSQVNYRIYTDLRDKIHKS